MQLRHGAVTLFILYLKNYLLIALYPEFPRLITRKLALKIDCIIFRALFYFLYPRYVLLLS